MASGGGNSSDESERMEKNERTVLNGVIAEEFAKRRKHKKSSADKNVLNNSLRILFHFLNFSLWYNNLVISQTSKTHGNYKAMASSAANPLDAMYSTLIDAKSSKIAGLTVQVKNIKSTLRPHFLFSIEMAL